MDDHSNDDIKNKIHNNINFCISKIKDNNNECIHQVRKINEIGSQHITNMSNYYTDSDKDKESNEKNININPNYRIIQLYRSTIYLLYCN